VVLTASPDMSLAKRIEVWIWVLIYIGMATIALGLSVSRSSRSIGLTMACFGIGFAVVGIVLIYVRSTMKDSDPKRVKPTESTEIK
jgi:hypothetical protein